MDDIVYGCESNCEKSFGGKMQVLGRQHSKWVSKPSKGGFKDGRSNGRCCNSRFGLGKDRYYVLVLF